jgi:glutathione S-transferase
MVRHVATFRQRSARRIMGRLGQQQGTLCGARWSNADLMLAHVRRMTVIEAEEAKVCPDCTRVAQRMEAAR